MNPISISWIFSQGLCWHLLILGTVFYGGRWANKKQFIDGVKWGPYKWFLLIGVITPVITDRVPPWRWWFQWFLELCTLNYLGMMIQFDLSMFFRWVVQAAANLMAFGFQIRKTKQKQHVRIILSFLIEMSISLLACWDKRPIFRIF